MKWEQSVEKKRGGGDVAQEVGQLSLKARTENRKTVTSGENWILRLVGGMGAWKTWDMGKGI